MNKCIVFPFVLLMVVFDSSNVHGVEGSDQFNRGVAELAYRLATEKQKVVLREVVNLYANVGSPASALDSSSSNIEIPKLLGDVIASHDLESKLPLRSEPAKGLVTRVYGDSNDAKTVSNFSRIDVVEPPIALRRAYEETGKQSKSECASAVAWLLRSVSDGHNPFYFADEKGVVDSTDIETVAEKQRHWDSACLIGVQIIRKFSRRDISTIQSVLTNESHSLRFYPGYFTPPRWIRESELLLSGRYTAPSIHAKLSVGVPEQQIVGSKELYHLAVDQMIRAANRFNVSMSNPRVLDWKRLERKTDVKDPFGDPLRSPFGEPVQNPFGG
ncbi:hypothetical protein [Stieleria varia]|uniref:Uncharacterized protein n=1 Tax=Stieleria varia TaxID=2528005 RepID=A0A5C6AGV1_9BACT|nr:hypothetical protein [Stieleria varia]TWT98670.1 hypothetical protein Pla52n_51870 [Stieleria varia]